MNIRAGLRSAFSVISAVATVVLTSSCDDNSLSTVPAEPWKLVLNAPEELIVVYMREDFAKVDYVREVGQQICGQMDVEYCEVAFWSDYELAMQIKGSSGWPEGAKDKQLARFFGYELAESVMIFCPKNTIAIVGGKPYCRPETGYWPLYPSQEN